MISILFSESAPYNTPYSEEKAVPWEKIKTEKKAWDRKADKNFKNHSEYFQSDTHCEIFHTV